MSAADVQGAAAPHPSALRSPAPFDATVGSSPGRSWSRLGTVGAVTLAAFTSMVAVSFNSNARGDVPAHWRDMLGFVIGLTLAGLLVLRRRYPVRLCVAASVAALFFPIDALPALLALTWVIASAARRTAWLCGAAAAAATGVALWRDAVREPAAMVLASKNAVTGQISYATPAGFWIVGLLCLAAAVGVGLVRRWRNVAAAALADKDAQVATTHQLRDRMTRQEERELIAREVHDTVAHHISLISLQASALEVDRGAGEPEVRAAAQQMRSSAQQAIAEMRGLMSNLRTGGEGDLLPGATLEDLAGLLDNLRRHGRWVTSSVYVTDAHTAAPALTRAVFRIVQESVTNALKHAPGQPVEVEVRAGRQIGVSIRVLNPLSTAPTLAPAPGTGSGMIGMRERTARFGGQFDARVEGGWHIVTVHLPWLPAT
jgi:signal transduction histidine kinase